MVKSTLVGWVPGFINGDGARPKGMHRNTFERYQLQYAVELRKVLPRFGAQLDAVSASRNQIQQQWRNYGQEAVKAVNT